MKNLEGIILSEIKESELEKKSITISDDYNFNDCVLTEKERLQKLMEELMKLNPDQKNNQNIDDVDDYDDCRKNSR